MNQNHTIMKKLIIAVAFILLAGTAFSQTLKKGVLIGYWAPSITLAPDVTMDQYMDFVKNKYLPAYEEHFPGMRGFIMQGGGDYFQGDVKNEYFYLFYMNSAEVFHKYFDTEFNLTEEGAAAMGKIGPIQEELDKLGTDDGKRVMWNIL
jgi:hypothetical protein